MNHGLVKLSFRHTRLTPKKYSFKHQLFWFKIDLLEQNKWPTRLVSFNKFNLYSFFEKDHIRFGNKTARENYLSYFKNHGVDKKIKKLVIYTQLRFLGYVFNPVSFVFAEDIDGNPYAIIEIANTFNEIKPYFVSSKHFDGQKMFFSTKKYFYISPFLDHDNELDFYWKFVQNDFNVLVNSRKANEKQLTVSLKAKEVKATTAQLILLTLIVPAASMKAIFLIHFHALILFLKKIKFHKKDQNSELQKEKLTWKT